METIYSRMNQQVNKPQSCEMSFNSQSSRVDFDLFGEDNDISSNSRVILQNKQRKSAYVHNYIACIAGKISGGVFFFFIA